MNTSWNNSLILWFARYVLTKICTKEFPCTCCGQLSKCCFLLFQDQYRYSSKKCENKETFTRPEYTPRPPPGGPTRDYTNFIILGVILLVIIIIVIVIVVVFCKACMKPGANSRTNRPRRKRSEGPMSSTNLKRVNSWHSIHDGCIDNDDPNARFVIQNRILVGILLKFLRNFAVVCFFNTKFRPEKLKNTKEK